MVGIENIKWLGHASFQIKNSKVIYIDPWKLTTTIPADIILVSHEHYDHCSPEDISKIQNENTVIVAPVDCASKLSGNIKTIKPGESVTFEGVTIEAVAAYNKGKPFHPKSNLWVGYIITLDDVKIYHAGDTDLIPEMERLKVDIALLPIGGTYTMDVQQAATLVNRIKPKVAIPMHYGSIVGDLSFALKFKQLCETEVKVLEVKGD